MRRGPAESATQFAPGARRRGLDGRTWTVVMASNGVRRWGAPSDARGPPAVARGAERAYAARRHRLVLTEPSTWQPGRRSIMSGVPFTVDQAMYDALRRAPRALTSDTGNAYLWGRRFPRDTYERVGDHGNDVAQTGIIDLDTARRAGAVAPDMTRNAIDAAFMHRGHAVFNWDNRAALRAAQRVAPWVLFLGETRGGDVGATLYVHRTAGAIDGVLIENNCVFAAPTPVHAAPARRHRRSGAR